MSRMIVIAALACLAVPAFAADPPKDDPAWSALKGKGGAVPNTYDLGTRAPSGSGAASVGGADGIDVLVERFRRLPTVKDPEPEQRDVFETDRFSNNTDDKLDRTRSNSRDGCHAGTVCYGDSPRLRDSIGSLFGD
jgi:hypothetical protein